MARKRSDVVLVRKGQTTMIMDEAARQVAEAGFRAVAAKLGIGESTLRTIMAEEGYRFKRSTSWQVEKLPGMEAVDAPSAHTDATGESAVEPARASRRLGGVEAGGV